MRDRRMLGAVTLFFVAACAATPVDERVAGEGVLPEPTKAPEGAPGPPGAETPSPGGATTQSPPPANSTPCPGAAGCVRTVFVTSATYRGYEVGGIDGADAKCNALAAKSTHPKVAGRKFVAWLSHDAITPAARFVHGTTSYELVDGTRIAKSFAALSKDLEAAIDIDENGAWVDESDVWSATSPSGSSYGADCSGWKGNTGVGHAGRSVRTAPEWSTLWGPTECTARARIYCFER